MYRYFVAKKIVGRKITKKIEEDSKLELRYLVETATSITRLNRKVNSKLDLGFTLIGGMSTFTSAEGTLIFSQTMKK